MRTTLIVLGVLLALAGAVWIAQGLNLPFAPNSFMTADRTWVLIGVVTVVAGLVVVSWGRSVGRREQGSGSALDDPGDR